MAVKYIKEHPLEYDQVIWIDGSSLLTAQKSFMEAAAMFGFGAGGGKNPEECIAAILDILRSLGKRIPGYWYSIIWMTRTNPICFRSHLGFLKHHLGM